METTTYLIYAFSIFVLGFLRILYFQFEKELGLAKAENARKKSLFDSGVVRISVFLEIDEGFFTTKRLDKWNVGSIMLSCFGIFIWPLTATFFLLILLALSIHKSIMYVFRWFVQWVIKRGNFVEE